MNDFFQQPRLLSSTTAIESRFETVFNKML